MGLGDERSPKMELSSRFLNVGLLYPTAFSNILRRLLLLFVTEDRTEVAIDGLLSSMVVRVDGGVKDVLPRRL